MVSRNQEIDDIAVEWAAKTALRDLSRDEQAELDAWLAVDVRHLGAFTKARAVMARLDRVLHASTEEVEATETPLRFQFGRRRVLFAGGAGVSMAAACLLGVLYWKPSKERSTVAPANFSTAIGQTREVLVSDGSVITLNTNSRVSVELTPETRKVRLLQGEALFDVAKDKNRPFVVYAGDMQVRAVGTSFAVTMLPTAPIHVVVREGVVEVKKPKTAAVWLSANTRASAVRDAPIVAETLTDTKVARQLSWQYGRIAIDHGTLQDAANEFARYSDVRIVVDPTVADRTVTGMFAANDPAGFAKAAATVLKLRVDVHDKEVRIFQ
jgi:transmembrane sensor